MKKILEHIRNRVVAGFIFLIPVFAIILLLQKLWTKLSGAGNYLVQLVGLKSLLGSSSVPIAIAFLLVLLFYAFGWLVKISSLNRMKDWIEVSALQYIPGYLTYKAQIQDKVNASEDKRIPVWVATAAGKRPGLLIDEKNQEAIVFFPNSPDSNNGEVLMVERTTISKLEMTPSAFLKCLQKFGKDLVIREKIVATKVQQL